MTGQAAGDDYEAEQLRAAVNAAIPESPTGAALLDELHQLDRWWRNSP
jgi:hypothetical protein